MLASGIRNFLVLALDEETLKFAASKGAPSYLMELAIPQSQRTLCPSCAVSSLKFTMLQVEFPVHETASLPQTMPSMISSDFVFTRLPVSRRRCLA